MYKILGADQKEYGPVTSEQLRQWIAEGRANAQSRVKVEGSANWQPLGSLPEFAADLSAKLSGGPPVLTVSSVKSKTSGMAIASLVLGVLGFFGITALVGLILGIVALVKVNRSQGRLAGNGFAIAGICVSAFMLLFCIPFLAVLAGMTLPALSKAKSKAQEIHSINNMRQLVLGVRLYASDHNGQFPPSATWCDAIQSVVGSVKVYQHPTHLNQRCGYAYNQKVSGVNESKVDPRTVVIFESDAGWNGAGGPELLVSRQKGGNIDGQYTREEIFLIGFAAGSVKRVPRSQLNTLRWEP